MNLSPTARWTGLGFLVLLGNSAYLAAFATPSIFYMGNVVLHIALGTDRLRNDWHGSDCTCGITWSNCNRCRY